MSIVPFTVDEELTFLFATKFAIFCNTKGHLKISTACTNIFQPRAILFPTFYAQTFHKTVVIYLLIQ